MPPRTKRWASPTTQQRARGPDEASRIAVDGLTLDTGALVAFERGDRGVVVLLTRALQHELELAVPAGVVAQVWRDGRRQARLPRLLGSRHVTVETLDDRRAREAGQLCGAKGTRDVVDASVVLCARRRRHRVLTSDPDNLAHLDPALTLIPV